MEQNNTNRASKGTQYLWMAQLMQKVYKSAQKDLEEKEKSAFKDGYQRGYEEGFEAGIRKRIEVEKHSNG